MKRGFRPAFLGASYLACLYQTTTLVAQPVNVLTQHNDNARTGANLQETQLTTSSVSSGRFGALFSLHVDGQIYAQPLYVSNLGFPDGSVHNVVYVATMQDSVFAFDADNPKGQMLWTQSLGEPVREDFMPMVPPEGAFGWWIEGHGCTPRPPATNVKHNISPKIGITSTPVIDLSSNTIYVVAKTTEGSFGRTVVGGFGYRLHALDLLTGNERPGSPVIIDAFVGGKGAGSLNGGIEFNAKMQLQRPGLLLSNGMVYVAFGAHQDTDPYHGWVFAYDAKSLESMSVFNTTPDGWEGGIWQSGNGLAADDGGNVYFMVGNGAFDRGWGGPDLGDSFVKLSPTLSLLDWFTPYNFKEMTDNDSDLGSAGPMLLKDTSLLVGGDKHGIFYLVNRDNMGHLQGSVTNIPLPVIPPPVQEFQAARSAGDPATNTCGADYHNIHGSPVTWNSPSDGRLVYVWPERDKLKAFRFDSQTMRFSPTSPVYRSSMSDPEGDVFNKPMPGGMLSVSANGSAAGTGIVWATLPLAQDAVAALTPGILRAFDASNVGNALWCGGVGTVAKFTPPTIANGKVYVATFDNRLMVYGDGAHQQGQFHTGYKTQSSPFVYQNNVYFQGTDDKLWQVSGDGSTGVNLGGFKTKSSPFVANRYAYFWGTDNKLWKVSISDPTHDNTNLGGFKTQASPFIDSGYVYFRGTDDKLWQVSINDPTHDNRNLGGFKTHSTPFVSDGYAYFQGTDDKLWQVSINDPTHDNRNLGGFKAKSSPFVLKGYVYFQGTDDKLWRVSISDPAGDRLNPNGLKTHSSPRAVAAVPGSTFSDSVYFQGTDDQLWRVTIDGSGLASPNCNKTKSTPFVEGDRIFFQGTDDRLLVAGAND